MGVIWHAWPHTLKMTVSFWRNLWQLSADKNQLHPSGFPWDIAKILKTCFFGHFGHVWLRTPKVILWTCRKCLCLSAGKKSISHPILHWRYCKGMQTYFGYFGYVWLYITKRIGPACRMFIYMPKIKLIHNYFLGILYFKESCNFIGLRHLGPESEDQNFARNGIGVEISIAILVFVLYYFQEKLNNKIFQKI